jgi:hypothetical protein
VPKEEQSDARWLTWSALSAANAFLHEVRRRGFRVVENAGQFVVFCNRDPPVYVSELKKSHRTQKGSNRSFQNPSGF